MANKAELMARIMSLELELGKLRQEIVELTVQTRNMFVSLTEATQALGAWVRDVDQVVKGMLTVRNHD